MDKIHCIGTGARRACIAAISGRIAVIPGIYIVSIIGIRIILHTVLRMLFFPDKACHLVAHHGPGGGIVGKWYAASGKLCVNWCINRILCILPIK